MAVLFVLIAALLVSISNFCFRRSIDAGGSSRAYLIVQLTFSFFVMIFLNPIRTGNYIWDTTSVILGLLGGVMFGLVMWCLGKTLEKGPAGLTFAFLNSSTVLPGVIMALLFGPLFDHSYTLANGLGSLLVVLGLFWAGRSTDHTHKRSWMIFVILMFCLHALFLVYLQWWALLLKQDLPRSPFLPFSINPENTQWFMPAVLFAAALIQAFIYLTTDRKIPKGAEISYGILGGITNAGCTFFLILAPQYAKGWENAMIFPIFSVAIILICNGWAQILYKESVNWRANGLCVIGLLVGTIAWHTLS